MARKPKITLHGPNSFAGPAPKRTPTPPRSMTPARDARRFDGNDVPDLTPAPAKMPGQAKRTNAAKIRAVNPNAMKDFLAKGEPANVKRPKNFSATERANDIRINESNAKVDAELAQAKSLRRQAQNLKPHQKAVLEERAQSIEANAIRPSNHPLDNATKVVSGRAAGSRGGDQDSASRIATLDRDIARQRQHAQDYRRRAETEEDPRLRQQSIKNANSLNAEANRMERKADALRSQADPAGSQATKDANTLERIRTKSTFVDAKGKAHDAQISEIYEEADAALESGDPAKMREAVKKIHSRTETVDSNKGENSASNRQITSIYEEADANLNNRPLDSTYLKSDSDKILKQQEMDATKERVFGQMDENKAKFGNAHGQPKTAVEARDAAERAARWNLEAERNDKAADSSEAAGRLEQANALRAEAKRYRDKASEQEKFSKVPPADSPTAASKIEAANAESANRNEVLGQKHSEMSSAKRENPQARAEEAQLQKEVDQWQNEVKKNLGVESKQALLKNAIRNRDEAKAALEKVRKRIKDSGGGSGVDDQPRVPAGNPDGGQWTEG